MNRRTLLAGIGGASLAGTAGCYGLAQLITGDDDENSAENTDDTEGDENATDSPLADAESSEGNTTSEETASEENSESDENGEESDEDEPNGNQRPEDAVDTISVIDHGLNFNSSDDPHVETEIICYGTFEVGEHDLRDVRIDGVALAENGDELDHGWVPFFEMAAGERYDVETRFFVDEEEIAEYRIGATEATYAE